MRLANRGHRIVPTNGIKKVLLPALLTLAIGSSLSARAAEIEASDPTGVNLTIYNQDFAVVKENRTVDLTAGINYVRVNDVAEGIDPTTVSFSSLTAPNSVVVREQNYQYDLLSPSSILDKSIGKPLTIRQFLEGGRVNEVHGILLSQAGGMVVKTDAGIVLQPPGEITLASLPAGLISKPSLLWKLESTKAGLQKTEVSYQTSGLGWHCDYVAVLNKDDNQIDLTSWVTLDNKSGTSYQNAGIKLLAGDVHKVVEEFGRARLAKFKSAEAASVPMQPQFTEESFSEYHLYSLQGKTSVSNNETKQLSLFSANQAAAKKLFVFEPQSNMFPYGGGTNAAKVNVKVQLENSQKNGLGMPMPKGKIRVYKRDADGALQFIGEDSIDHTPKDEKIRIYIGNAFDVVGEQKQISQERLGDRAWRYGNEVSLRNHKNEDVKVTVVEHAYGDWSIPSSSMEYTKKDSHTFEYVVPIKANSEAKLTYTVETR